MSKLEYVKIDVSYSWECPACGACNENYEMVLESDNLICCCGEIYQCEQYYTMKDTTHLINRLLVASLARIRHFHTSTEVIQTMGEIKDNVIELFSRWPHKY